jgi:hypothetical protein
MEINENGALPLTDDEAESVTGGESLAVQAWRRVATGEGRPVQIGVTGAVVGALGLLYEGWVAGKCPSCGEGEALFASSHTSRFTRSDIRNERKEIITYRNCKCYICRATWSELFLFDCLYDGKIRTIDPGIN